MTSTSQETKDLVFANIDTTPRRAIDIWRRAGKLWTSPTFKRALDEMVRAGLVVRESRAFGSINYVHLYHISPGKHPITDAEARR